MARQVVVLWDNDPIAVRTISAGGPIRVGADDDADVMLPVEPCVIDGDGDTTIGRFVVRVSPCDEKWVRGPFRLGVGPAYTAVSALIHAAVFASMAIVAHVSPANPGADEAARLAAMKGYVARAADRGTGERPSMIVRGAANVDVSDAPSVNAPSPAATAANNIEVASHLKTRAATKPAAQRAGSSSHADTGSAGVGLSGAAGADTGAAFRTGDDWTGTYMCPQGRTDLLFHVVGVHEQDVSAVFDFTHAPTGAHGAFRMHGRLNPVTGEASMTPDEWIERPPFYMTVGMSGRFTGNAFNGIITSEGCRGFNLHRRAGKV